MGQQAAIALFVDQGLPSVDGSDPGFTRYTILVKQN